jgi:hypothetical protein
MSPTSHDAFGAVPQGMRWCPHWNGSAPRCKRTPSAARTAQERASWSMKRPRWQPNAAETVRPLTASPAGSSEKASRRRAWREQATSRPSQRSSSAAAGGGLRQPALLSPALGQPERL